MPRTQIPYAAPYEDIVSSMSAATAFGFVRDIAKIGNRWLGTTGEGRAREYIIRKFREFGLENVREEEFGYVNYVPERCKLGIVQPVKQSIDCQPLEYSRNQDVTGEVAYVGEGTEAEFRKLDKLGISLRGKIVAVSSFAPFLVTPRCEERKAAGMIVISDAPKNYIRSLTAKLSMEAVNPKPPLEKYLTSFPGVVTSVAGGERLLSLLSVGKVRARVSHRAKYSRKMTSNVIGVVKGEVEPQKQVIVGGHYDSQLAGELAWDNGTGVAAVLEMARVLARSHPKRTVVFIAFSAEEIGLLGSAAYAQRHTSELKKAVGMINLDALSTIFPAENAIWATKNIERLAREKAREARWKVHNVVDPSAFVFSDYYPFMILGIPSTWIWEYPPIHPYYHTENDILEYIDDQKLLKVIEVNARLAFHLAYVRR